MRKVIAVLVGGLVLTARSRVAPWMVVVLMRASVAHAGHTPARQDASMTRAQLTEYVDNLVGGQRQDMERLAVLERACAPRYTGGGVTQCAQPGLAEQRLSKALRACMTSSAYLGVTEEDTWALKAQCMDDWQQARP